MSPGGHGPRPVGDSVPRLLRRLGAPASTATMETVFTKWESLVGPELAAHTRPVRLDGATLVVAVDHAAWGTRARMDAARILEGIRAADGTPIERLEVVVERL
jgi:predicted nucleic acid-binding Zn ribbon protein